MKMIFLICKNCNWEIIPMLLGAWMLGLLFWIVLFRKRHRTSLDQLNTKLDQASITLEKNKRDAIAAKYKNQKLTDEVMEHSKTIKSLEYQIQKLDKE